MFQIINNIELIKNESDEKYLNFYEFKADTWYLMKDNQSDDCDELKFIMTSLTSTHVPILTLITLFNNKISYSVYDEFEHMRSICEGRYFSEVKIDIRQTSTRKLTDYEKLKVLKNSKDGNSAINYYNMEYNVPYVLLDCDLYESPEHVIAIMKINRDYVMKMTYIDENSEGNIEYEWMTEYEDKKFIKCDCTQFVEKP